MFSGQQRPEGGTWKNGRERRIWNNWTNRTQGTTDAFELDHTLTC